MFSLQATDVAGILTIFLAFLFAALWFRRRRNLPPGPYGLPVVGYLPFMTDKPHLKLQRLKEKYGPIFSLQMGSRYVVVLCDYYSIKEAFAQDAFGGRPPDATFELHEETKRLGAINGARWKDQRKAVLSLLRDLGFGKKSMEQFIVEEINELLERMGKEVGKPVHISKMLAPSISNNVSALVFGKRRKYDDPKRVELDRIVFDITRNALQAAWHSFFPWLREIAKLLNVGRQKMLKKALGDMRRYVREEIAEHRESLDANNVRDFIDAYLLEIQRKQNDPMSTFTPAVLEDHVNAFFGAGSETIRVTLDWLLLVCAAYPDIQRRIQAEIDDVIGRERFPSRDDQKNMPFTDAVTMETMRWRTIAPINLLRYTLEDTHVHSYFIPKGTYVIANLWEVHHDTKLWGEDAEDFRPQRFLTEDGKQLRRSEYYMPFSTGKRSCPGEPLAVMETFLYFTALLQKFNFKLPSGAKPNFEGYLGIGLFPQPYELILEFRK